MFDKFSQGDFLFSFFFDRFLLAKFLPLFLQLVVYNLFMRLFCLLFMCLFMFGCATTGSKDSNQFPAPHNNYTGKFTEQHFDSDDPNDFMMRNCKIYGGLNQDSIKKIAADFLLQDIYEFKCNYADKLQEELEIDGKSSKRLNGTIAKSKCEALGFKVGTTEFSKCMLELTQ